MFPCDIYRELNFQISLSFVRYCSMSRSKTGTGQVLFATFALSRKS